MAESLDSTDIIYPVHKLDDNKTLRGIIVTWTLRFDDVLDADILHKSLWKLLEIGDWRKLGGRLRLSPASRLEIHAPRTFTAERPPVAYSHRQIETAIGDDALGKLLPTASSSSILQTGPRTFQAFAVRENAPTKIEDYLTSDSPQIGLHITEFTDATLVGLSWPHTLMDVMGQKALVHAWSLVVNGRVADVPPLLGAREDVAEQIANARRADGEPFALKAQQLSTFGMIAFGLRFAWSMFREPVVEERIFHLSPQDIVSLMNEARRGLASTSSSVPRANDSDRSQPFVSTGDVVTAFFLHALARSLPASRPLTALHALNLRFRLPALLKKPGAYVQNLAIGAFLLLPASATAVPGSLGAVALANRRSLAAQADSAQALANLRELIPADPCRPAIDPATMLFGPSDALLVPFTNWTRAEFTAAIDFRGAVTVVSSAERTTPSPGRISYHHASSMVPNPGARNVFVLLGDDYAGNLWCMGALLPRTWEVLGKELERIRLAGKSPQDRSVARKESSVVISMSLVSDMGVEAYDSAA